jgi:hypothetical protein
MFLYANYCFDMFRPQLLAIFREINSFFEFCSLCIHFSDSVIQIKINIKILKSLKSGKYWYIIKL